MKAVVAVIRAPMFSVRRPSAYQAASAYPLPQPSTLVGALAYCIASSGLYVPADRTGDEVVRAICNKVLKGLVAVTVKPLGPISRSVFILTRLRTLEGKGETRDAMLREYYYGSLMTLYVFRDDDLADQATKCLLLVERLGDTESLVSVERVLSADLRVVGQEGAVDTLVSARAARPIEGEFTIDFMCPARVAEEVVRKPSKVVSNVETFYLPLREERGGLLVPTVFRVQAEKGYTVWEARAGDLVARTVLPEVVS